MRQIPVPTPPSTDVFVRLASTNFGYDYGVTAAVNPGEGKFRFSGPDGADFQHRPKVLWVYERLEIWSQGQSVLVVPTLPDTNDSASRSTPLPRVGSDCLEIRCHMLLLNGEVQAREGGVATTGLTLQFLQKDPNNTGQLTTWVSGKIGDTNFSSVELSGLADRLKNSEFFEKLQGDGKTAGPLLSYAYGSDWGFNAGTLQIGYQDSAPFPTFAMIYSPADGKGRSIPLPIVAPPLPVAGTPSLPPNSPNEFALPVTQPGQTISRKYTLKQTPSNDWLARNVIKSKSGSQVAEEWQITLEAEGFADIWNDAVQQYKRSLRDVRAANRLTMLPEIELPPDYPDGQLDATVSFEVRRVNINDDNPGVVTFNDGLPPDLEIEPFNIAPQFNVPVFLRFDLGLHGRDPVSNAPASDKAIRYRATLSPATANAMVLDFTAKLTAQVDVDGNPSAAVLPVRIGSLDLRFGGPPTDDTAHFELQTLDEHWKTVPRLTAMMSLPIADAVPGGQDGLPYIEYVPEAYSNHQNAQEQCMEKRFTGSAPVVVPLPVGAGAVPTRFLLYVQESNPKGYSQTVELQLLNREAAAAPAAASPGNPRVVVIDSDPFLVAAVDYPPLAPAGNSRVVALWSTGTLGGGDDSQRAWQLQSSEQNFTLTLPPQVLGEEMPKATEMSAEDGSPTKALDFRLGASMPQLLKPSDVAKNFIEAPWNLRRILGYAGQRDAGAGVVQLNYELLYGLSCSVDTPLLRLAEAFSLLGRIPGRIAPFSFSAADSANQLLYQQRRERWSLFAALYSQRIALLEPRASGSSYGAATGASGASATPDSFVLSQGVSCSFRGPADLRYSVNPLDLKSLDDDHFAFPGNDPTKGLRGGVTWPFEAPRLLHATVQNSNSKSTSASVSGLMLSPLGGTGTAKAGFDHDLSVITAVTDIGRTNKVTVARMGRIGVFHNLSRYVIEYERDVSVSDQFKGGAQTPFRMRPVLRKVREYVEILEPIATLSNSTQPIPGGGCVRSIEFKQRIIPVKNAWASNVGDNGWKIPLWYKPDANPTDGMYAYTLPNVVFNMAGADSPDATSSADVECSVLSVDKLCFYTETDADADANPHNWPIVSGIDFLPVPPPQANPAFTSSSVHEVPAYDPPTPFGLASFTHQIAPGHGRVNLVNGRTPQAIGAVLSSVTLQRGPQRGSQKAPAVQTAIQKARDIVRGDLFSAVRGPLNMADKAHLNDLATTVCTTTKSLVGQVTAPLTELQAGVIKKEQALLQNWANLINNEISNAQNELVAQMQHWDPNSPGGGILGQKVSDAKAAITNAVTIELTALRSRLDAIPASANALAQFAGSVQRVLTLFQTDLKTTQTTLNSALAGMSASISHDAIDLQNQLDTFSKALSAPIKQAQALLSQLRSQVQLRAEAWMPGASLLCHYWEDPIVPNIDAVQSVLTQAQAAVSYANAGADDQIQGAHDALVTAIGAAQAAVAMIAFPQPGKPEQQTFVTNLTNYAAYTQALPQHIANCLDQTEGNIQLRIDAWIAAAATKITAAIADSDLAKISNIVCQGVKDLFDPMQDPLMTVAIAIAGVNNANAYATNVVSLLINTFNSFGNDVCSRAKEFQNLVTNAALNQLEAARRKLEDTLSRCAETLAQSLPPLDIQLPSGASVMPMLQHAFGEVPQIPNLGFSLPNAAYFFNALDPHVNLTPLLTKVRDLVPNLTPLSTSVPCFGLSDRALPVPHLPNFDLSNIFPDFAGLQLANLFPSLKMPLGSSDTVKVTHGIDAQSRTAWIQADIDLKTDTATIFSVGPMAMQIVTPEFTSRVHAQADITGKVSKEATGAIKGDWQLVIGGSPMVTLASTSLTFDKNGKLHVDVSPDRVRLSDALSFVQQIVAMYTSPDDGFGIYPSATGIETRLSLPIPDTNLGTTGISNLNFNFLFGLNWANAFSLYAGFGLASADAPFNLAVYILGGGGYLTAKANYVPGGKLTCGVDMGMDVSAALAISLGPISGGVHINLGMRFKFDSGQGDLALGFYLIIGGEVSILGIISASILLRLDAMYQNGSFECRGLFQIKLKICWCFTLEVHEEVSCRLGSGGGLAYNEPASLPGVESPLPYAIDSASFSTVPTLDEFNLYPEYAKRYMQLIS